MIRIVLTILFSILTLVLATSCNESPTAPQTGSNGDSMAIFVQQPMLSSKTTTGFAFSLETNLDGKIYFVVLTNNAPKPSKEDVVAGSNSVVKGNFTVQAEKAVQQIVTGLAMGTSYDLYAVLEDEQSATTQVSTKLFVTTSLSGLAVQGNRIVDMNGREKVLRGVAVVDPLVWQDYHGGGLPPREIDFAVLAQEWQAKIVRVPIHPDLLEHNPNYLRDYVDVLVEWGDKYGIYVFIGYHAHGNPNTEQVEETPWGNNLPWHGNPYNPNKALAISSLSSIAERYKDKQWVIYGTFNEPAFITWREWRPEAEDLVDAIRAIHPEALVMVSGVNFGSELDGVLGNPINRTNIVYEVHPYPWAGEGWKNIVAELSQVYPVFLGEWGFGEGQPGTAQEYGVPLVDYCKQYNLGWTAWIWDNVWTPKMFHSTSHTDLTEFGAVVKNALTEMQSLAQLAY